MHSKRTFGGTKPEELLALVLIVAVFSLAYLPRIDQLGFYKDDWHMIYNGHTFGPNRITDSFLIDRPMMGRLNTLTYRLLGDRPLAWSLFAVAARLEGVLAFYTLIRLLWPRRRLAATAMTLLFAIYPGFLQLPNAATFQNHFLGYGAALTSIVLTLLALRLHGWRRWLLTALALLGTLGYLLIYEYMVGLEGLRLALIVYHYRREQPPATPWKRTLGRSALAYLPYLLPVGGFVYWRLALFSSDRPATNSDLIWASYLAMPLGKLAHLAADSLRDFVEAVWMAWSVPLYDLWQDARSRDLAIGLLLGLLAAAGWWAYARKRLPAEESATPTSWPRAAVLLGALGTIAALLPVLVAGRNITFQSQFDRYTLHATAGICLLIGGALFWGLRPRVRLAAVALLIGLAVPVHYLNATYWSNFWTAQREFWWQVVWRAPSFQDDTLIMAELPQGYRLAEDYEIFSAANLVYHPEERAFKLYGEVLNADTARKVILGEQSYRYIRSFELTRDFSQALVIDWPGGASCVHFIDGERMEIPQGADSLDYWVGPYSHIDQVLTEGAQAQPLADIFGSEPAHGWCYYYQQADLARQRGDWQAVAHLYTQAQDQGLQPADTLEWLPFYQAFSALGQANLADELEGRIRADGSAWNNYCAISDPTGVRRTSPGDAALCQR
jgi:hypothetical protein